MYFKFVICFLLLTTVTSNEWEKFKQDYNKQYSNAAEESIRKQIFLENVEKMKEFQRTHPDATFTIGINHLADRRPQELVTGPKVSIIPNTHSQIKGIPAQIKDAVPTSLDWRTKGVISPVYDQGQQGISGSIVAVEVIESYHAIRTKKLIKGSIEQVARCCSQDIRVFDCILTKLDGSICEASAYNSSSAPCSKDACPSITEFTKVDKFQPTDENTMLTLLQDSPLFVGIDASVASFLLYQTGVYRDEACSKTNTDHALQLVGYGTDNKGTPYWILKNSWSTNWGDKGYIYIERNLNTCGITNIVERVQYNTSSSYFFTFHSLYLIWFCFISHFLLKL